MKQKKWQTRRGNRYFTELNTPEKTQKTSKINLYMFFFVSEDVNVIILFNLHDLLDNHGKQQDRHQGELPLG